MRWNPSILVMVSVVFTALIFGREALAQDLRSDTMAEFVWQWDNHPDSIRVALENAWSGHTTKALALLQEGQSDNKHAQETYRAAFRTYGRGLWTMAATASSSECDLSDASLNINRQFDNNFPSLRSAYRAWRTGNELKSLSSLLSGQGQNIDVMNLYRACFRDHKIGLFDLLQNKFP